MSPFSSTPTSNSKKFDWVSRHDERSRDYPVRAALPSSVVRKRKSWYVPKPVIDQGREGACVGFGWTNELRALPVSIKFPDPTATALGIYRQAKLMDEWAGEDYEGTSVLAGAKVAQSMGFISMYRWAFGIDDVIDTIVTSGPVVLGIPWYDSMYGTRKSGLIDVSGSLVGGHCILATGYNPKARFISEGFGQKFEIIRLRNSWGSDYGVNGDGFIRVEDLSRLLSEGGEACVPVGRMSPKQ